MTTGDSVPWTQRGRLAAELATVEQLTETMSKALLQTDALGPLEGEMAQLHEELSGSGWSVEFFTKKQLQRNQLDLQCSDLVAGEVPVLHTVLKMLGFDDRVLGCYPTPLSGFLHRSVSASTLGQIRKSFEYQVTRPLFIKPKSKPKLFTGCVVSTQDDLWGVARHSKNTAVYCVPVVVWLAEWRIFVLQGQVLGTKQYDGQQDAEFDLAECRRMIQCFEESGQAPVSYALDIGVLEDGTTALIEANDALGLGSYGLANKLYTQITVERWKQLTEASPSSTD